MAFGLCPGLGASAPSCGACIPLDAEDRKCEAFSHTVWVQVPKYDGVRSQEPLWVSYREHLQRTFSNTCLHILYIYICIYAHIHIVIQYLYAVTCRCVQCIYVYIQLYLYIYIHRYTYMAANQKHWPCNRLGRPFRDKGL